MSRLTRILALLTLALWGLASMHCKLEGVAGLAFLHNWCCTDSEKAGGHRCGNDGCRAVEDDGYRTEEQGAPAPEPLPSPAPWTWLIPSSRPDAGSGCFAVVESPPEFAPSWRFTLRSALPPRAPSPTS